MGLKRVAGASTFGGPPGRGELQLCSVRMPQQLTFDSTRYQIASPNCMTAPVSPGACAQSRSWQPALALLGCALAEGFAELLRALAFVSEVRCKKKACSQIWWHTPRPGPEPDGTRLIEPSVPHILSDSHWPVGQNAGSDGISGVYHGRPVSRHWMPWPARLSGVLRWASFSRFSKAGNTCCTMAVRIASDAD